MIDPKRLTEADKGREVVFRDGDEQRYGGLASWDGEKITVKCYCHGALCNPLLVNLDFAHGTYQDGGTE